MFRRTLFAAALAVTFMALHPGVAADRSDQSAHCRTDTLRWVRAYPSADQPALDRWCAAVGPAIVIDSHRAVTAPSSVVVASWNMAVGKGDLRRLVETLSASRDDAGTVILIQEAFRAGDAVPLPGGAGPSRIRPPQDAADIVTIARELGYWAAYVPSMRNGFEHGVLEDRGNAILSTVPLGDVTAIELPFGKQRRVAVAATVSVADADGDIVPLRVYSMHLDTNGERVDQARALLPAMEGTPGLLIAAGDLNARWGKDDEVFQRVQEAQPPVPCTGGRTFKWWPWRLDHVFGRVDSGWTMACAVQSDFFGSDHRPLVVTLATT